MLSRLCTAGTPPAQTVWRSLCPAWRRACSSSSGEGPPGKRGDKPPSTTSSPTSTTTTTTDGPAGDADDEDIDDGFGMDDFLVADDEADDDLHSRMQKLEGRASSSASDPGDAMATAELTSDLVNRMVSHLTRDDQLSQGDILPHVSPHTIAVLRAARICTNSVMASLAAASTSSDAMYPINRRVVAHLDIDALDLSPPASEAVRLLAGPQRMQQGGRFVKVSCDKFPTKVENRTYIVSRLHALVKQAKLAVGEEVDETPLNNWEDVVAQVEQQAEDEVREAGSVQNLLGLQQHQPFQQQQTR